MSPAPDPCPSQEEILRWLAGQLLDTPRGAAIGKHLASCVAPCGEYLNVAAAIIDDVTDDLGDDIPEATAADHAALRAIFDDATRMDRDVEAIFAAPAPSWTSLVIGHPERHREPFLFRVADKAVYYANEHPDDVRSLVAAVERLVADARGDDSQAGRVKALLALAEGVAVRTQGDHVGALECYARATRALPEPALEIEYPRINLARAASLRRLNRYEEARGALELACQGFSRAGIEGESKALWQLANLALETGDNRAAVRMGARAHRLLVREGKKAEAPLVLWTVVAALIALRRSWPARRLLAALEQAPEVQQNVYQRARLLWNKGMLAALDDWPEAKRALEQSAAIFAGAGAVLDAARVTLDLAHVAGERGQLAEQAAAAAHAAEVLGHLPGQAAEWATALAELHEAVRVQVAVTRAVERVRALLSRA